MKRTIQLTKAQTDRANHIITKFNITDSVKQDIVRVIVGTCYAAKFESFICYVNPNAAAWIFALGEMIDANMVSFEMRTNLTNNKEYPVYTVTSIQ